MVVVYSISSLLILIKDANCVLTAIMVKPVPGPVLFSYPVSCPSHIIKFKMFLKLIIISGD